MARLLYSHPLDNRAFGVTPTASSSNASFPVSKVANGDPSDPFKFGSATAGQNLVWDLGSAKQVDVIGIFGHLIDAGLEVRIQANTSSSWGAPPLNQLISIPTWNQDNSPVDAGLLLTSVSPRTYQFWRLILVGANSVPAKLGEVWLGFARTLDNIDILYPVTSIVKRPSIESLTEFETELIYDMGVKLKALSAQTRALNPTALNLIRNWWDACYGKLKGTLVWPDSEAPDVYGPMMVRWSDAQRVDSHVFPNITEVRIDLREMSKGVP